MSIFDNITNLLKFSNSQSKQSNEIGASGTNIQYGIIQEDFNTDWQFEKSVATVEEMMKSDAQVNASLLAVWLPLLTANWSIEMDEEGDEKIEEFIEEAMFEKMEVPFYCFFQ